jgi:hypothetical protein
MKRLAVAVVTVAVMAMIPAALAAGTLSGKYKEVIKHDQALGGHLNGTWVLDFSPGKYSATDNGHAVVKGKDSIKGDKITFQPGGSGQGKCPAAGKYKFKLSGSKLRFTVISDSNPKCAGRRDVLTHGPLTKVS